MPLGQMKFNKAIFDRWSLQRIEEFERFLSRAESVVVTTEGDTIPDTAYIYTINHPDFLFTDGIPFYTFIWGKVLDTSGVNRLDTIISLHIQRENYTFELVRTYITDRNTIYARIPSLR